MFRIGIVFLLCATVVKTNPPTLRDLVNPWEQTALRDTLSDIVELEYKDKVVAFDHAEPTPDYKVRPPTVSQLNQNYSDLLYQADIRLPTHLLRSMISGSLTRKKRTTYRDRFYPSTIWKDGVPFAFHKSMNAWGRRSVLAAIQFWRKKTCIRFRRRTKEKVYLLFVGYDYGCWSTVGRDAYQGQQLVSIGRGCEAFGITSHEVAHALGLFHEQSRYDRDNWITVFPNRVPRSQLYNFAKVGPKNMRLYGTAYDIGSIMQYTPFEFSTDPRVPSMIATNINDQGAMGQLAGPSFQDVQIMNHHYGCPAKCRPRIQCHNGGIQYFHDCRICICPSGYGGRRCGKPQPPSIRNCGGKIHAKAVPRRMRLKIKARKNAGTSPRTCIYHIMSPRGTRIHLTIEKVVSTCMPGCWREAAEFKTRNNKGITGNRFCCTLTTHKRILANSNVVPVMLKSIKKPAEIIVQYSFVNRNIARDDEPENVAENSTLRFGPGVKTFGDDNEFEMEIQPLDNSQTGEQLNDIVAHDENTEEPETPEDPTEFQRNLLEDLYEMPPLDPDLEDIFLDGNDNVEVTPMAEVDVR
ncbi:unnamed protein product [Cylicocyclus nassatus]|uniref:Metalloendopeptidase n=1 Tax=Cylicocyclus nassatus TaxID=53992 RepID=A0AA36H8T9_CYLNA|nr:unnamed protein product [Cylicocyclus nassatus]